MCSGSRGAPPCAAPPRKGAGFKYYFIFLVSYFIFLISDFLFLKIVEDGAAQCSAPPRKGGALLRSGKRRTTAATETEIGGGHILVSVATRLLIFRATDNFFHLIWQPV